MSGAENLLFVVFLLYLALMALAFLLRIFGLRIVANPIVRMADWAILLPFTLLRGLLRAALGHHYRRKRPLAQPDQPTSFAAYSRGPATESGWYLVHRQRRDILQLAGPYREPYQDKPPTYMLAVQCPYKLERPASTWYWISAPDCPGAPLLLTPVMSNAERRAASL
jgi:hypothetical protein